MTKGSFEKTRQVAQAPVQTVRAATAAAFQPVRDPLEAYPGLYGRGTPLENSRRGRAFRGLPS